jgi:hypothetical protein
MDNLVLIYEDDPWQNPPQLSRYREQRNALPFLYIIQILIAPIIVLALAVITGGNKVLVFSIFFVVIVLPAIIYALALTPTKYQIFIDRISIVRYLFVPDFDIPFSNIESVTETTWVRTWGLNLNFINSTNSSDILRITRKRGAKVHITPFDRPLFLENLNKAMADWKSIDKTE